MLRTARLVLSPISPRDLGLALELGRDSRVMASLGGVHTHTECERWLERQLEHWREHGYGRFRVDAESRGVGFVGLSRRDFDRALVPGIELAWRLAFEAWGHGYATEAAQACIAHGFSELGLHEVIAVTSVGNTRSRAVMARLGMQHVPEQTFEHPELPDGDPLRTHVVYRLSAAPR